MVKYIKEKDFGRFAKGKVVKNYPNPYVKNVDGEDVFIIPDSETVTFKKMSESDVHYYVGNVSNEVYEGSVKIGGWFPTEIVCGTVNGSFSMRSELAKECGWLQTNGTFGSKNDAFLASRVKIAARKLENVGFKVVFA